MSTIYYLRQTDLVRVRRCEVGNLTPDTWSYSIMSVEHALKNEQWDTIKGTMSVEIVLHNTNAVQLRTGRFISHGSIGDNCVYNKGKRRAYVYFLEPYEIENYDYNIKQMKAKQFFEQSLKVEKLFYHSGEEN